MDFGEKALPLIILLFILFLAMGPWLKFHCHLPAISFHIGAEDFPLHIDVNTRTGHIPGWACCCGWKAQFVLTNKRIKENRWKKKTKEKRERKLRWAIARCFETASSFYSKHTTKVASKFTPTFAVMPCDLYSGYFSWPKHWLLWSEHVWQNMEQEG